MVEHYKKTFTVTQFMIAVVAIAVLAVTHRILAALAFVATMEIGALLGAFWAARLKGKIERARWRNLRA